MIKRFAPWIAAACGVLLLLATGDSARADRRIALVVGNAHYGNTALNLSNPKNDADDVADALRAVGFEVMKATDASKRDLDLAMAKFARAATDSDAALFFYAGHALQYQGRNYLIPTDAEVEDEVSLRYQLMPIDDVRAALDRATGVKVMILDACRNNPIVDSIRRRTTGESRALGGQRGLARIDKTQGMVIAYSTAADEVAADGSGRNSPFTRAFLKRLREPGLEIEQLFRRVAADVNTDTGGRQRPETYVSLLSDYYLNQTDRTAFDAVKESSDPATLRDFISKFPSSSYASDARYRIQRLELQAQEKQFQQIRQEEAARRLDEQRRAEQDAARKADEQKRADEQRRLDDQRTKQAEAERLRLEREAAQRQQDEQQRQKAAIAAAAEAQRPPQKLAGIERVEPATPRVEPAPPTTTAPSSAAQPCDQDIARLARLRSNPVFADVAQFEREMTCDRLRPQVARLRESLAPTGAPTQVAAPATTPAPVANAPPPPVVPPIPAPQPERLADLKSQPAPPLADQAQACKRDEPRLARLRAEPSYADVVAFERDLGCDRLRPQVVRLRESLAPVGTSTEAPRADASAGATQNRQATVTAPPAAPPPSPEAVKQTCDQERAALARLRSNPSRDDVLRFERGLNCEALRPQVTRLRESLADR